MQQELEIIQGVIGAVVFQNYDNGYAVLRLSVECDCRRNNSVAGCR